MLMNKDLFLDGREFISASRAAKKLGYVQDYVGELIRSQKVPGRMIGRTWYVDILALTEHKKNRKVKNKEKLIKPLLTKSEDQTIVILPKTEASPKAVFLYEKEEEPKLPELSKGQSFLDKPNFLSNFVVVSVSTMIIFSVSFSWISTLAPTISEKIDTKIVSVSQMVITQTAPLISATTQVKNKTATAINAGSNFLGFMSNRFLALFSNLFNKNQTTPETKISTGMVVLPDGEDHEATVAKVRQAFSDDVNISVDQGGDSGVITPVFRYGEDTENYAFIMVPVKEIKKSTKSNEQ